MSAALFHSAQRNGENESGQNERKIDDRKVGEVHSRQIDETEGKAGEIEDVKELVQDHERKGRGKADENAIDHGLTAFSMRTEERII